VEAHADRCKVDLGEGVFAICRLKPSAAPAAEAAAASGPKADVSALSAMLSSRWKSGGGNAGPSGASDGPKPGQVRQFKIVTMEGKKIDLELA
jgi:hypothetical protein